MDTGRFLMDFRKSACFRAMRLPRWRMELLEYQVKQLIETLVQEGLI